jgi:hypothetical protein
MQKMIRSTSFGFGLLILLSLTVFSACQPDDDDASNLPIDNTIVDGTWRVTRFSEDGVDETSHFSGYDFTFVANGAVTATNGATTVNGTWAQGTDDSTPKLILNFNVASGYFEEISEDWRIESATATRMELKHVSGGNGGIDLLTFMKN